MTEHKLGIVSCPTCEVSTEIETKDNLSLIQALETGVLSYHVRWPCCGGHEIKTQINLPHLKKHHLEIECIRCRADTKHQHRSKLITEVPMCLVNTATICFHTSHEGHRFHLKYTNSDTGELIYEIMSPVEGRRR